MVPLIGFAVIIGWVVSAFVSIGSAIVSSLAVVVPILISVWNTIFSVFKVAGQAIARVSTAVWKFVEPVWTDVLRPVVETLLDFWEWFRPILDKVLSPILDGLEWVMTLMEGLYDTIVRPVLEWMERARLVLSGLGQLGVEWADELAGKIGEVQQSINNAFQTVYEYLYQVTNIINDLLDPGGWIKGRIFLSSIWKWSGGAMSILVGVGIDPNLLIRRQNAHKRKEIPTIPMITNRWTGLIIKKHPAVVSVRKDWKAGRIRERSQRVG